MGSRFWRSWLAAEGLDPKGIYYWTVFASLWKLQPKQQKWSPGFSLQNFSWESPELAGWVPGYWIWLIFYTSDFLIRFWGNREKHCSSPKSFGRKRLFPSRLVCWLFPGWKNRGIVCPQFDAGSGRSCFWPE